MKTTHWKIALLLSVVSCSTHQYTQAPHLMRSVASTNDLNEAGVMENKVQKLVQNIFHSYLLGQVYLTEFDAQLDKNPGKAMKSESYQKLLAVRSYVDEFEEQVLELYVDLVTVSAHPQYSAEQKQNAEASLKVIGNFLDGIRTDKSELPENLRPLVLGNLRDKQTDLYERLQLLKGDVAFTNGSSDVETKLHDNMVLLRATRKAYAHDLSTYEVDASVLAQTLKTEQSQASFKALEKEILKTSKDMKAFTNEIGRGTSSASIYPSASSNGNVTGNGYPANTWSLTYDDGPGKTSPGALKNLLEKKIPATFFQLAKQVEALPGTALAIKNAGMDMACHSYDHAQLTKLGPAGLEKQITTAKKIIETKLDIKIKLFRLPYGAGVSKAAIRAKIAENKMVHVFWNVDTLDWQDKNPKSILARAIKQMKGSSKNAGIILFHDIHPQSITASGMLMDYFNDNKNIKVCTVQGVIDQINEGKDSCK
jgi:peptidoglycan/xylan/chitin deacetylase (PgdA/CDA1 family)